MKIGMSLLIRDEIDIIKHNINFHLPLVDKMIITDNGSVDGTFEYLQNIKSDKVIVWSKPEHNYLQDIWMTEMALYLQSVGIDWVINSDADEFWIGNFRKEIESSKNFNCIYVNSQSFCSTYLDDVTQKNPILRIKYRFPIFDKYPKVITATKELKGIMKGNDGATFTTSCKPKVSNDLAIYHYAGRGLEHYKTKYLNGGKAIEASIKAGQTWNSCWSRPYMLYKEQGMEAFVNLWEDVYLYKEDRIDNLIYDDVLAKIINNKGK